LKSKRDENVIGFVFWCFVRSFEGVNRVQTRVAESEDFGWSRNRILSPTPDVQLDDFLHHIPKLGIPVEMVQLLLKLVETYFLLCTTISIYYSQISFSFC